MLLAESTRLLSHMLSSSAPYNLSHNLHQTKHAHFTFVNQRFTLVPVVCLLVSVEFRDPEMKWIRDDSHYQFLSV